MKNSANQNWTFCKKTEIGLEMPISLCTLKGGFGLLCSAVVDTGATSIVIKYGDGIELTGNPFTKVFKVATEQTAHATETATMEGKLCEPAAQNFDMVPDVTLDSLASTSKMCNAGYFTAFDEGEVQIYDAETVKVVTSKPPVLKGWREKIITLWRIPIVKRAPRLDDSHVTSQAPGTHLTSWDI